MSRISCKNRRQPGSGRKVKRREKGGLTNTEIGRERLIYIQRNNKGEVRSEIKGDGERKREREREKGKEA